jgi:hypothetical protein
VESILAQELGTAEAAPGALMLLGCVKNGIYVDYHTNGQKRFEGEYKSGKRVGLCAEKVF